MAYGGYLIHSEYGFAAEFPKQGSAVPLSCPLRSSAVLLRRRQLAAGEQSADPLGTGVHDIPVQASPGRSSPKSSGHHEEDLLL